MSGGQSCDVSVRDPAGGAENFVLATPPPACGEGGHETPPPGVKVVVRLTRSFEDFVLATPCSKWRWWTTRRALYETWTLDRRDVEDGNTIKGASFFFHLITCNIYH